MNVPDSACRWDGSPLRIYRRRSLGAGPRLPPRPITAQRMTTAIERWCAHMLR